MKIIKVAKKDKFEEKVAELAHDQWSGWMEYLFEKCSDNEDGSVNIPLKLVKRWKKQMENNYENLSEEEKDSDRKEAKKFISLFNKEK